MFTGIDTADSNMSLVPVSIAEHIVRKEEPLDSGNSCWSLPVFHGFYASQGRIRTLMVSIVSHVSTSTTWVVCPRMWSCILCVFLKLRKISGQDEVVTSTRVDRKMQNIIANCGPANDPTQQSVSASCRETSPLSIGNT